MIPIRMLNCLSMALVILACARVGSAQQRISPPPVPSAEPAPDPAELLTTPRRAPKWRLGQQPTLPPNKYAMGRAKIGANAPLPKRPPHTEDELNEFVESVDQPDAKLEVVVGQGRLVTLKSDLPQGGKPAPLVAVGDPTIVNFEIVGPRHIRVIGQRLGITDLSILTGDNEHFNFQVHVIADLEFLQARLEESFPEASLELNHLREHVVVKGEARDTRQVAQIIATMQAYLNSIQMQRNISGTGTQLPPSQAGAAPADGQGEPPPPSGDGQPGDYPAEEPPTPFQFIPEAGTAQRLSSTFPVPEIINLIRVPGPQQVLLKVQIAELNRTAMRQLGVSFLFQNDSTIIGSRIGGALPEARGGGAGGAGSLLGLLNPLAATGATAFGVFDSGDANLFFTALRQNQVLTVLAEPNLVAMNGQQADFLSGGEYPILVPQPSGAGAAVITVQYRRFGVQLNFVPFILDDSTIRLAVAPEVSALDFATGTSIAGTAVPGLSTRSTSTTVEIKEGQSLAISGILQETMDGTTARLPFFGDLPVVGSFFSSNITHSTERELIILVTPYLVNGIHPDDVGPLPGDDVIEPTDWEFYAKGRIERRKNVRYRATAAWDDPSGLDHRRQIEIDEVFGPYGYSE